MVYHVEEKLLSAKQMWKETHFFTYCLAACCVLECTYYKDERAKISTPQEAMTDELAKLLSSNSTRALERILRREIGSPLSEDLAWIEVFY